jgi:WD40 repeat protein
MYRTSIVLTFAAFSLVNWVSKATSDPTPKNSEIESPKAPVRLQPSDTQSEYENWVKPYKQCAAGSKSSANPAPPKLVVTEVTEKEPAANEKSPIGLGDGKAVSGLVISHEGEVKWFSRNSFDYKESCCSQIDKDGLARIDGLLSNLPDDHSRLPPIGRRLVLQVPSENVCAVRVYDLANAPDTILELLRFTRSAFRSYVLSFEPETEWTAWQNSVDGGLAATSDGQQIISSGLNGPIKIWDSDSHNVIREIAKPQNVPFDGLILSPNDSTAVIEGWGVIGVMDTRTWHNARVITEPFIERKRHQLSHPHFMKNGRFLLLESDEPALQIYDAATWTRRSALPEIPADAIAYYSSPSENRAIYQTADNQIICRAVSDQHDVILPDKAKIKYVVFSPDEARVAVVTFNPGKGNEFPRDRIKVWDASNGKFVRELFPFERDVCESVEGIMWSPDGKYILAANKADAFFTSRGISIWSLKTGRHRGELTGCPTKLDGLAFLRRKNKVVASCGDGIIRMWDLETALAQISEFEKGFIEK